MTWVPPFFICGECGGEIGRWPMKNLLKQDILDWRHRTVPGGVTEHRAILGTKAHTPRIIDRVLKPAPAVDDDVVEPDPVPPPEIPARPALHGELPGPAVAIDKLADANGWSVQAWLMRGTLMDARWKANRVVTTVVLHLERDGHRIITSWVTKKWRGVPFREHIEWDFEGAWSVAHGLTPLGGNEMRSVIKFPRMVCEHCGEPPALHHSTKSGLMCHDEFLARGSLGPTPGGTPCSSD